MAGKKLSQLKFDKVAYLEEENKKLKEQILALTKLIPKHQFEVSDEQSICEMEIKRLHDIAVTRALNLEETKKLDLYVKNLKLVQKEAPPIDVTKGLTDTDLIKIVDET
jgi:hypothetical protein